MKKEKHTAGGESCSEEEKGQKMSSAWERNTAEGAILNSSS